MNAQDACLPLYASVCRCMYAGWDIYISIGTGAGAAALNGLISQFLHIGIMPMVRPDWWRDRSAHWRTLD